jgi:hypothetical protein
VDVVVRSNEREQGEVAILAPYQFTDVVEQVEFLYAPTSCELEPMSSPNCIKDIGIATRIRFYEIVVTATDSAGRQDTDTCHVIIVPQCGLDNTSEECEDINGISYLKRDHLKDLTDQSRIRFKLATSKVVWGFGELDQNFDDLHAEYNSRLVASGSPSTEPSVGKGKGRSKKSPRSTKAPNAIKGPRGDTPTAPTSGIIKIVSSAVVASTFIASAVVASAVIAAVGFAL